MILAQGSCAQKEFQIYVACVVDLWIYVTCVFKSNLLYNVELM